MVKIAIFFIVLGFLIKYGKMYFLIAGYNTLPKKEKEKFHIDKIATVFRNVMLGIGIITIVGHYIARWVQNPNIEDYAFWSSLAIGMPYLIIESNSEKYRKHK